MASSSSCTSRNYGIDKCDVFISFRGSDVRSGFLSHLYYALEAEQILACVDNDLGRGNDITGNLFKIIEQSDLSVVIFSPNYPKSEWCLKELEKIHECMNRRKQVVIPVFYKVDPTDVQDSKGDYAIQLQKQRDALMAISNLSGFDSSNSLNDAKLVRDIVDSVSMKLREICPTIIHEDGLFGIDSRIKEVELLLRLDSTKDVRMVGIWGMGGIGKTTIASKVFDKIKKNFCGYFFASNVRDTLSARDGLINLRDKIVCELLNNKNIKIHSPFLVDDSIGRRLKRIRVLLVLDDVHTCMELKSLLESSGLCHPYSFCPGSRIIVTSRDLQVIKDVKLKSTIYEAKELNEDEALQLLSWNAFGQKKPEKGYEKISNDVLRYAHGVPLALVVLGSQFKDRPARYWEASLKKIVNICPLEIRKILRISFDGLDREEKNIFLDIACFLKGGSKDDLEYVLKIFGYHASIGINRLVDKSLLKVEIEDEDEVVTMHNLVQQMGHEIVGEGKERKGHQSRLWKFDDIKEALTNNRGSENVEVILLQDEWCGSEIDINSEAFIYMHKLRYLNLDDLHVNCPMGLKFLPNSIKILVWDNYPLYYFPSNYHAHKLVVLIMHESQLKEISWTKRLVNLILVDLSYSKNLVKISDLGMAPNLERMNLSECENLVEIGSSLENLNKLNSLDVSHCRSLSYLPELPYSITELELEGSGLRKLPSTIGRLALLKHLSLSWCERLERLPSSISCLSSLESISLLGCRNLPDLPDDFGNLESLKEMYAGQSGLRELPDSIQNLKNLTMLDLSCCQDLMKLPEDFGNLESLREFCASGSGLTELPQSIQNLRNLIKLKLCGCRDLMKLPDNFANLESLEDFDASYSGLRELPPSIQNMKSLTKLDFHSCEDLMELPDDFGYLESLEDFDASNSGLIEIPQSIQNLQNLSNLNLSGCKVPAFRSKL